MAAPAIQSDAIHTMHAQQPRTRTWWGHKHTWRQCSKHVEINKTPAKGGALWLHTCEGAWGGQLENQAVPPALLLKNTQATITCQLTQHTQPDHRHTYQLNTNNNNDKRKEVAGMKACANAPAILLLQQTQSFLTYAIHTPCVRVNKDKLSPLVSQSTNQATGWQHYMAHVHETTARFNCSAATRHRHRKRHVHALSRASNSHKSQMAQFCAPTHALQTCTAQSCSHTQAALGCCCTVTCAAQAAGTAGTMLLAAAPCLVLPRERTCCVSAPTPADGCCCCTSSCSGSLSLLLLVVVVVALGLALFTIGAAE